MPSNIWPFQGKRRREENDIARRELADEERRRNARENRSSITGQVYDELWFSMQNQGEPLTRFVCFADQKRIWNLSRIEQLAEGLSWRDPRLVGHAYDHFIQVMSILVWIRWDLWEDFGLLFLEHKDSKGRHDRTDGDLPFKDTSFLPNHQLRVYFQTEQYIFKPIYILDYDPDDDKDFVEYTSQDRLPFIDTTFIADGGSGTVYRETIPPNYFGFKNGSYNTMPMVVARKSIRATRKQSFLTEQKSLKAFKQCLESNENIMQSYTAFLHGENFTIISPLADMDLLAYFKGEYDDFETRSRDFTPAHLLYGAGCLAGALRFLHEGLQPFGPSERIYCAHLDLKPENILVQWSRNPSEPAGRWKVHDFGTAKIKSRGQNSVGSTRLVAPGDFISQFSYTQATRTPGPFQAPEVQDSTDRVVGTESDVWSLGCICACTLAFARGGPTAVTQLYTSLEHESDNDYFYVKREGRFALKESVEAYLESLASGSGGRTWGRQTLNLIYDTLVEDPRARPTANDLQMTLRSIFNGTEVSLTGICPWALKAVRRRAASPPPPGPVATPHLPQPVAPFTNTPGPLEQQLFTVILRAPTGLQDPAAPVHDQDQPGLEVVHTPTATTPTMMSDFESLHHRPYPTVSRSSSTSTRPVSLTDDITFFRVSTPGDTFKSIICPDACHAAFISKRQVAITRIMDQGWSNSTRVRPLISSSSRAWTKAPPVSFKWVDGCMAGRYIVLRAERIGGEERKLYRYKCDDGARIWVEDPLDAGILASEALDITVSIFGDILFICDDKLQYYTSSRGFFQLPTRGRHRNATARFSPNGRWIFAWSFEPTMNHFYKYDTHYARKIVLGSNLTNILKQEWHLKESFTAPERPGEAHPAIYPFLNYFVAFDRPDRIYTIGKDKSIPACQKLDRGVRDVVGGMSLQGVIGQQRVESLMLLQGSTIITLQMTHDGAGAPSEGSRLTLGYDRDKDAVAVMSTDSGDYIVVVHKDGKLERRRVS